MILKLKAESTFPCTDLPGMGVVEGRCFYKRITIIGHWVSYRF